MTFAFLGDEIYVKAGMDDPVRRHYGNYPQIEDGVGMIRSFLNSFEKLMARRAEPSASAGRRTAAYSGSDARTHPAAIVPSLTIDADVLPTADTGGPALFGTILTGEMFAPILAGQIDRYNSLTGARLTVMGVPNTYFGGDVSVAGLLTGQDYINIKDKIVGDFVIIPKHTIKSDEPILLDGMQYDDLKQKFGVPIYDLDTPGLIKFLSDGPRTFLSARA